MDFLELARERYSVRKFAPKKVEGEKLDAVLEAGRLAPTAVNYQPQRILVLDSDAALGLGSTWVGHFDPQKVRSAFALPENVIPVAILPLGYPHESSVPSPKHAERLPLSETTRRNTF